MQYHFSSLIWIKKKLVVASQWCNIISFLLLCEWKETHLRVRTCAILFFLLLCEWKKPNFGLAHVQYIYIFTYVNKKTFLGIQMCNIISFFSLMWVQKTICGVVSVKYHFFSSFAWVERNYLWACKCAILIFFYSYVNKKIIYWPTIMHISFFSCVSGKNHFWTHKCAISFFSSLMWRKKSLVSSQVCNIISFLLLHEWKKSLLSSQVCYIIFFFTYMKKKITCKPTSM